MEAESEQVEAENAISSPPPSLIDYQPASKIPASFPPGSPGVFFNFCNQVRPSANGLIPRRKTSAEVTRWRRGREDLVFLLDAEHDGDLLTVSPAQEEEEGGHEENKQ